MSSVIPLHCAQAQTIAPLTDLPAGTRAQVQWLTRHAPPAIDGLEVHPSDWDDWTRTVRDFEGRCHRGAL